MVPSRGGISVSWAKQAEDEWVPMEEPLVCGPYPSSQSCVQCSTCRKATWQWERRPGRALGRQISQLEKEDDDKGKGKGKGKGKSWDNVRAMAATNASSIGSCRPARREGLLSV